MKNKAKFQNALDDLVDRSMLPDTPSPVGPRPEPKKKRTPGSGPEKRFANGLTRRDY